MYVTNRWTGALAGSPVDLLTSPDGASLFYPSGQDWEREFAVNRTVRGTPVRIMNGWWMRGFEDFERKDLLYLIDAERKILSVGENNIFLLTDGDKIAHEGHHIYHGTVSELVRAFQDSGYALQRR